MHDFANFGHYGRCAISLGRKRTVGVVVGRGGEFRLFGKTLPAREFANFGNRGRLAISLGRETGHWPGNDFAYLGNVAIARFR